ncbi:MAG TPA: hypothetical protein VK956_17590 [Verrucomicrobium sp.]|nr:hypothetical protein [Verrucomicrobium sp.]
MRVACPSPTPLTRGVLHLFLIPGLASLLLATVPAASLEDYRALAQQQTWQEQWPDAAAPGGIATRQVTAGIWTQAMQACLDATGRLDIPARAEPYYLDGPLVLKSGQMLVAAPTAEIRLRPGTNTCVVRNANPGGFAAQPVDAALMPDTDITVEGGIWTTLATGVPGANSNNRGASSREKPIPGTHGVILLHNVRRVQVRNITVRQSRAFAVHLANAREFLVQGVKLEEHGRDGVHVNGPASHGVIRDVSGVSHDDTVALNAWEWQNYAPSYGAIHDITIENIHGAPAGVHSADSIRLLPGVKRFPDGTLLDCPIHDIVLRNITDIREFKCYDQPNLELGRDRDFSAGMGTLRNIRMEGLVFHRPGLIEIHANAEGVAVRDVQLKFPQPPAGAEPCHLVRIGPKSQTYKGSHPHEPGRWTEIFSPDLDCTVKGMTVERVRWGVAGQALSFDEVVKAVTLAVNPEYPKTTPKGGTGKGVLTR